MIAALGAGGTNRRSPDAASLGEHRGRGGSAWGCWPPPLTQVVYTRREDRAVLPGVRDMVAHAGRSLQRVEGFEVPSQVRVHPRGAEVTCGRAADELDGGHGSRGQNS